jgi:peptidoglycan hydrolase CwlO-like protein
MKNFIIKYYKEILIVTLTITTIFLLLRPNNSDSKLLDYKLEELDRTINSLKEKQNILDNTIKNYESEIAKVDSKIENIRNQKTTINNYYDQKQKEIPMYSNKQLDSLFKLRYKY